MTATAKNNSSILPLVGIVNYWPTAVGSDVSLVGPDGSTPRCIEIFGNSVGGNISFVMIDGISRTYPAALFTPGSPFCCTTGIVSLLAAGSTAYNVFVGY